MSSSSLKLKECSYQQIVFNVRYECTEICFDMIQAGSLQVTAHASGKDMLVKRNRLNT